MVSAIVLAAGMSTRMGAQNKLLLRVGDETFISRIIEVILASSVGEIIVVLGHEKEKILNAIGDRKVIFTENPDYKTGMTSSIQAGVKLASGNTKGFMICLSDMPMITTDEFNMMLSEFEEIPSAKKILIPTYKNKKGNPVIFHSSFRQEILSHKSPNGCRGVIAAHPTSVYTFEMPSPTILNDVDTPEDFSFLG